MKLAGKVALITGAGRGLGKASAIAMARQGAAPVLVSRTIPELEETAAVIRGMGRECLGCQGDVSKTQDIDILMNNAAVVGPVEQMVAICAHEWNAVLAINLSGAFVTGIRSVIRATRRSGLSLGGDEWHIVSTRRRPSGGSRRLLHLGLPPDRDTAKRVL